MTAGALSAEARQLPDGITGVPTLNCGTGSGNLIIEGDNRDTLVHLMPELAGKVKMIYIDPPYNTGNSGMGYKDRHDDWSAFMVPRLSLGLMTLRDDGAMFISIDEREYATLVGILRGWGDGPGLPERMGLPHRYAGTFVWVAGGASNQSKQVRVDHEYVVMVAGPKCKAVTPNGKPLDSVMLSPEKMKGSPAFDGSTYVIPAQETRAGSAVLRDMEIMGFSYPKPVSLVQGLIECFTSKRDGDLVLDYFAGSGTTGHAVLAQNAKDGGNRRFILAVLGKDEYHVNVARDVCAKRVRMAAEGYVNRRSKQVAGLGGGFTFAVSAPLDWPEPEQVQEPLNIDLCEVIDLDGVKWYYPAWLGGEWLGKDWKKIVKRWPEARIVQRATQCAFLHRTAEERRAALGAAVERRVAALRSAGVDVGEEREKSIRRSEEIDIPIRTFDPKRRKNHLRDVPTYGFKWEQL